MLQDECECPTERKLLAGLKFTGAPGETDFIHPLRLLLKTQADPEVKKYVDSVPLDAERWWKADAKLYGTGKADQILETIEALKLQSVSKDNIKRAVAFVEGHNIPLFGGARGVYMDTARLQHACSPNTYYSATAGGWAVYRAGRRIAAGTPLTTCRVRMDKCNYFRRKQLEAACIDCRCERCQDGTEYGTGTMRTADIVLTSRIISCRFHLEGHK